MVGYLSANRRVITLDQIGFGQSGKPPIRYTTETLCSFLEGFYETLRLDKASVVAHGVSGAVAIRFAAARPNLVDRMVLANTGFLLEAAGLEFLNPVTRSEARDLQKRTRFSASEADADQLWADSLQSAGANQALIDSAKSGRDTAGPLLASVAHPTLVIWGRGDRFTPLDTGERIHAAIPHSQMVILEKAGHAPHRDQPAEFSAVVEKFLSGAKVHQKFRKQRQEENVWF